MAPLVAPLECPGGAPADARPPAVAANSPVSLRRASVDDARAVARLMAIAGEGIPMWLWGRAAKTGQDPLFVGTERAARPEANFSYRNAVLAQRAGQTVGMMLGYRLEAPTPDETAGLGDLPEPLRPFAELEARVPGSFYVNALAVFDAYRDSGIGTRLLQAAAGRATALGCPRLSLMVFSQNIGAVRLYERNGYRAIDARPIPPHSCHPYDDRVLLMARTL
jgi:ribosomal protein S18 acetylase RimI-like enzyme